MSAGRVGCGCVRWVCVRYWRAVARCGGWRPLRKYCTQLSCEKSAEWRRGTAARPSPATRHRTLLSRDFQPAAQHRQLGGGRGGGGGVQGGDCGDCGEITPGPGPASLTHIQAVTQSRGNTQLCTVQHCPAPCKEGNMLIAPSFQETFPNPELSVRAAVGCGCGGRISCAAQCRVWRRTVVKVESDSEQAAAGPGPARTRSQAR